MSGSKPRTDWAEIGPGITVCHKREDHDTYGGRAKNGRRMDNTPVGERGWLGNPYKMHEKTAEERRRVIAMFVPDFYARLSRDPEFREAVEDLRGDRVACWCRRSKERSPPCHLDIVDQFLRGGRMRVRDYLTGELGAVPSDGGVLHR